MTTPTLTPAIADLPERWCGIAAALDLVGDRWSLLIVREVWFGNRRFSRLAEATGAPRDRLAARLKTLVETGILERREYQTTPARSEYVLTTAGLELAPVLLALFDWGLRHGHVRDGITVSHGDHAIQPVLICAECGQPVDAHDVTRTIPGSPDGFPTAGTT